MLSYHRFFKKEYTLQEKFHIFLSHMRRFDKFSYIAEPIKIIFYKKEG
jgi:hypothetical protein